MKKILSIILTLCLALSFTLNVFPSQEQDISSNIIINQEAALKHYKNIKDMFKSKYNKDKADYYAGSYIDDNGDLNVLTVDDGKEIKDLVKTDKVKVKKATYKYNYLNNIINSLNPKMIDLGICEMGIDEEKYYSFVYF